MKIGIEEDEIFPYYYLYEKGISEKSVTIDIPEEKIKEYKKIQKEWEKMQNKLGMLYESASNK